VTPLERDYKRVFKVCSVCGSTGKRLSCPPCGTNYCGKICQRIAWKRGHRRECRKIVERRKAAAQHDAAQREEPPEEPLVFYGPAPRSRADEARARIVAEHEAARALREATPDPQPASVRFGSRCPICLEAWNVNVGHTVYVCCCQQVCTQCSDALVHTPTCPLCRTPAEKQPPWNLMRGHADRGIPEAINFLADSYNHGTSGLPKSRKRAFCLWRQAAELGNVSARISLGSAYQSGRGVKRDHAMAREIFRSLAVQGHAHHLFAKYLLTEGTSLEERLKNFGEAADLFFKAANQGYADALFYVGFLYDPDPTTYGWKGLNDMAPYILVQPPLPDGSLPSGWIEVNLAEARRAYECAASEGHAFAKTALESKKKA
jgi:hypothetical protein